MTTIGVGIPAYEARGRGADLVETALRSISTQTILPDVVVVSCEASYRSTLIGRMRHWSRTPWLELVTNQGERGIAGNSNSALSHLTTSYQWILHQDDRLGHASCVETVLSAASEYPHQWFVAHSTMVDLDARAVLGSLQPRWSRWATITGRNWIGAPSVAIWPRADGVAFDKHLEMLVDLDFYLQLVRRFGPPRSLQVEVEIGSWSGQTQHGIGRLAQLREALTMWTNIAQRSVRTNRASPRHLSPPRRVTSQLSPEETPDNAVSGEPK